MILNPFDNVFIVHSLFAKENSWLRPWSIYDHEFLVNCVERWSDSFYAIEMKRIKQS